MRMKTTVYAALVCGIAVAVTLAAGWHLVNVRYLPLTSGQLTALDHFTVFLCPSSLMLMDVEPKVPLDSELAISYLTVILLNGLLYMAVFAALRKVRDLATGKE
jgi:hypothetical protein